ncbi:hypothetical protein B0H15DRAFT_948121 [Mycena belliarum]|uniref:Uncharacterized protein n=1 Tax=Mycena belliarum TaxID=1033014 RepID=A0AAD6U7D1_9AGAR|nr:hypothetical protein B0H15DRAFT_948121 [Mycena belliae]
MRDSDCADDSQASALLLDSDPTKLTSGATPQPEQGGDLGHRVRGLLRARARELLVSSDFRKMIVFASALLARSRRPRRRKGARANKKPYKTFSVKLRHNRMRLPMAAALDELFETIDARPLTPDLRVFATEYLNAGFDDSFSPEMPLMLLRALQPERKREVAWLSHALRAVTIVGAGEVAASDMSRAFPSARVVCLTFPFVL